MAHAEVQPPRSAPVQREPGAPTRGEHKRWRQRLLSLLRGRRRWTSSPTLTRQPATEPLTVYVLKCSNCGRVHQDEGWDPQYLQCVNCNYIGTLRRVEVPAPKNNGAFLGVAAGAAAGAAVGGPVGALIGGLIGLFVGNDIDRRGG